ncbi:HNH endonuclease signature motif containing protein [Pseudonocardia sp. DLS-67]
MPGVVELIDRVVDLPPGPQLSALLGQLPWSRVPNARLVEVLQARSRQLAHEQAGLLAGMVEISCAMPVAGLPAGAVARAGDDFEWASHEIAAGLTWTPTAADRELDFARVLVRGLPLVFAALEQGLIDRGKAKVFCDHLDPARGELTPAQIRRLCERFVPLAPGWTARRLSRRLLAAILAIDPEFHRRRYRRGLRGRGVALYLNRDGTATLSGEGLPPDEAAAAAARLDRLAEAAKRVGHPGRLAQICADLFLGMLDGSFYGLTEGQILARLLDRPRPGDTDTGDTDTDTDVTDDDAAEGADTDTEDTDTEDTGTEDTGTEDTGSDDAGSDDTDSAGAALADGADPAGASPTEPGVEAGVEAGVGARSAATGAADQDAANAEASSEMATGEMATGEMEPGADAIDGEAVGAASPGTGEDRWRGERVRTREGIEVRVGLATVLGHDQRPAQIPGLGPVDADIARATVARQRRGAQWQFAIVDAQGYLLLAGPLRRRPRVGDPPRERVRGGVVELHLTVAELHRFAADPDLAGEWTGVIAEIADQWADRHRLWRELSTHPRARFARAALGRHVQVRDRTCIGPGCERPARRSQLDHTWEHAWGGHTVEVNLGPCCWRHHPDKDRGWTLNQPEPGHFVWISPLGRIYRTRGEPIRPDLPDPDPPADGTDPRDDPDPDVEDGHRIDPQILWREGRDPPPSPPPAPDDEEEPPF